MCKISVRNDIIKDILKKKNDVRWISDGTIVIHYFSKKKCGYNVWSRASWPSRFFFIPEHDEFIELEKKTSENQEGDWALNILQHLLIKLAVDNKFVIASYPSLSLPLDESNGKIGDTSFGMILN